MKLMKPLLCVILGAILLVASGCSHSSTGDTPVGPSDTTPKVYMSPSTISTSTGSNFTVNVFVENITNLYFASVYITYDPAKVSYVSSSEGGFLNQGGVSTTFQVASNESSATGGLVKRSFGISRTSPSSGGASGTGTLFSATFKANAAGNTNMSFSSDSNDIGFRNVSESDIQMTLGSGTTVTIN